MEKDLGYMVLCLLQMPFQFPVEMKYFLSESFQEKMSHVHEQDLLIEMMEVKVCELTSHCSPGWRYSQIRVTLKILGKGEQVCSLWVLKRKKKKSNITKTSFKY